MNRLGLRVPADALKQLSVFAVCLVMVIISGAAFSEVTWHHPPDKVVVSGGGMLHMVLEVRNEDPANIEMYLNDVPVASDAQAIPDQEVTFLHYFVQLKAGSNKLEASWQGGREQRAVFYMISWGPASKVPTDFTPILFHNDKGLEENCTSCHDLQSKPGDEMPLSPEQSTCYACHYRIVAFSSVHGPASNWACTFCHEAESTPVRYATPQPMESELCFRCHTILKAYFDAGPYRHGPVTTGRCTICHNPHASDNLFQLKRPAWYLCTSCHTRNADGRHIIAWGPTGDTHPTRGKPDPIQPHRELACNSCHNPHAAPSPRLWQFQAMSYLQLCITCHEM